MRVLIFLLLSSLVLGDSFEDYFNSFKSNMENLPQNEYSRKLLEEYKPKIYVHKDSYRPVDFYEDYVLNTVVKNKDGEIIKKAPTKEELIELAKERGNYLDLATSNEKYLNREVEVTPKIYGRIYRDKIGEKSYLFLKYNMVFPYSGLPASTSKAKLLASKLIGNPKAWHELDIHGAYHIILEEDSLEPVGILLNQHNYHKSYILGKDVNLPKDKKMEIAVAKYSNEPYLWNRKSEEVRTSGTAFEKLEYLYGRTNRGGFNSGKDYLGSEEEMEKVEVKLETLSSDDLIYTSSMLLGDKKKIFGLIETFYLAGPPGMDYYTHPEMKDLGKLFSFWSIDSNDDEFFQMIDELEKDFMELDLSELIKYQTEKIRLKMGA